MLVLMIRGCASCHFIAGIAKLRIRRGISIMSDCQLEIDDLPVVEVPVSSLSLGHSPRVAGHDDEHVRILAQLDRLWPPLLVRRQTYWVIDGMHRLLAAKMRGDETIGVRLYECDETEAFVLAVRMNVNHGLPLSLRDRKVAAQRIIGSRPEWSDRRVATVAGLSDKTVAVIRRNRPALDDGGVVRRIGSDGRSRPVDAASRRATVTRLLAENPASSLRQIADRAGVSPETVRSIRSEISSHGRDPSAVRAGSEGHRAGPDPRRCLQILVSDPALRSTDAGRLLLRVLSTVALIDQDGSNWVGVIPDHELPFFRRLAMANSEAWRSLAQQAATRETQGHVMDVRTKVPA